MVNNKKKEKSEEMLYAAIFRFIDGSYVYYVFVCVPLASICVHGEEINQVLLSNVSNRFC